MNIEDLIQERNRHTTSFFWLGLHIAFIFGIPAGLAVIVGRKMNAYFSTDKWSIILLFCAFVISWVMVGIMYKKKSKILNEIESKISELRKAEESEENNSENK